MAQTITDTTTKTTDDTVEYGSAMIKDADLFPADKLKQDEENFHGTSQFSSLYRQYAPPRNARFMVHPKYHTVYVCLIPGIPSLLTHLTQEQRQNRVGSNVYRHLNDDDRAWFENFFQQHYGDMVPNVRDGSLWVRCPYSITRPIKRFFADFDQDTAIEKMQKSPKWPQPPYCVYDTTTGAFLRGMTAEEIKTAWSRNGDDSSLRGTYAHLQFEKYFEDSQSTRRCDTSIPEWQHFETFLNKYVNANGWEPRIPEMLVVDDFLVGIFGFIDMVFYDPKRQGYVLVDYKRCKSIEKTSNEKFPRGPKTYGIFPLDDIEDCKFSHYALQLNLTRLILERGYNWKISAMYIVHVHPNAKSDRIVFPVPRWDDAPQRIVYHLRNELLQSLRPFCHTRHLPCAQIEVDQTNSALQHQWEGNVKSSTSTELGNEDENLASKNIGRSTHNEQTIQTATNSNPTSISSLPSKRPREHHTMSETISSPAQSDEISMEKMFKESAVHPAFPTNTSTHLS